MAKQVRRNDIDNIIVYLNMDTLTIKKYFNLGDEVVITGTHGVSIGKIVDFSDNSELKQYAQIIIRDKAETDLLYSFENSPKYDSPKKYGTLLSKSVTNDVALNLKRNVRIEDDRSDLL